MKEKILFSLENAEVALHCLKEPKNLQFIEDSARAIAECFIKGHKILIAGNGGSLCDASHFAEELTGFFRKKRKALPAIALNDAGHMSCVANDIGFESIFSRGIEALGKKGDIFIGLSTSGNSPNMILAFEKAKELGLKTIAFLGKDGGKLKGKADLEIIVKGFLNSDRIQEAHMTAIHIVIEMLENLLFGCEEKEEIVAGTKAHAFL